MSKLVNKRGQGLPSSPTGGWHGTCLSSLSPAKPRAKQVAGAFWPCSSNLHRLGRRCCITRWSNCWEKRPASASDGWNLAKISGKTGKLFIC